MKSLALLIGTVLPYLAVLAFVVGVVHRLLGWLRATRPPLMTLYPRTSLAREALLFPSLRRGDAGLWLMAWPFHVALALVGLGHLRAIAAWVDQVLLGMGIPLAWLETTSAIVGSVSGGVLVLAGVGLLVRRLALARVREISGLPDFFALGLLLAVIVSGDLLRFAGGTAALSEARRWAGSLLAMAPLVPTSPALLVHLFLAELLIAYLAFSKLMHFGGFFFTFPLIKRSAP